jgi:hypothetical protein
MHLPSVMVKKLLPAARYHLRDIREGYCTSYVGRAFFRPIFRAETTLTLLDMASREQAIEIAVPSTHVTVYLNCDYALTPN